MRRLPEGSTSEVTRFGIIGITRTPGGDVTGVTLNGRPLTLLSEGTSRMVYLWRHRFVVKVERGGRQGLIEGLLYKRLPKEDRKHFAGILHVGESFVIQAYVNFRRADMHNPKDEPARVLVKHLVAKHKLHDISEAWGGARQWGITRQGVAVIHDYGFTDTPEVLEEAKALVGDGYRW